MYIKRRNKIIYITKKYLITLFLFYTTIISANNTYYQHKISQFELLSTQTNKTIVMIGDSIIDRGIWNELTNRNDIINRGISGDTTKGVLNRLGSLNTGLKQAFIMIGVNDLFRGRSVQYIFDNYKKIITVLNNKKIVSIIQSTLYVGKDIPVKYNKKIKKLNFLLFQYSKKNKIIFIDLNKHLAKNGYLNSKFSRDSLHLNGYGYIKWTKIIEGYFYKE